MLTTLTNVVMESLQCACHVTMILFLRLTHAVEWSRTASAIFVILFHFSGTLTSGWGIPAGWHPENSLFDKQHMSFLSFYEEDDKRVVVPGLGG